MVEVSNNFIQECEANVGTYKFGKIKVNYIDDNPFNYEQGAYSSSNGTKIDAEQSIRYNKLVECKPNFKYKIELGNSACKMKIVTYNANQSFIAAHDNLIQGSELTTEATAKYISVTIYSNDTLEGTAITLNNTIRNGEILGAELKGNTIQDGTPTPSTPVPVNNVTGEQIIGIYKHNFLSLKDNIEWRADNTITTTIIDDDNITISYSGENATYKRLWQDNNLQIPNGHYDISCIATCTDNNVVVGIGIDVYPLGSTTRSDWYEIWFTQNAREQGVRVHNDFEIDNSQYCYRIRFFLSQSTGTTSNSVQFKDIMLKEYGDETEYEIYQGKKYEINLGKNLFEPTLGTTTISGVTFTKNDNGTYTANGTASEFIGLDIGRFSFSSAKTITYSGAPSDASMSTYSFNLKKIVGTTETWLQDELGTGKTITAEANTIYSVRLVIRSGTSVNNIVFKPMVEEGYQKTIYVPFFTPIELNKIGNFQDYIRKGTGKNLIEPIMASATLNGVTCTNNGDGSFTLNGTATASTSFRLDQSTYNGTNNLKTYNGTYTLSCSEIENGLDLRVMQNSTWASPLKMINSNTPVTGIIDKNNCFTYINVANGKSVNNLTIRPMLEKSSSATSYEPYACTGKNLFDKNTQLYESSRYIDGSGQVGTNTEWSIFKTNLKPNTTYTLTNSGASSTPGYVLYNSSGERVGGSNYLQRSHITFTTTSDTSYMLESVVANTSSTRYDLDIFQIEQSSTATSYEPYVYSTLKDKWYIEKNTLKLVVPNAVTGTLQNSNKRFYVNGANLGSNNIIRNTSISQTYGLYCDILGEVTAGQTWNGTQGLSYDYNSTVGLGCMDFAINGLTTIAEYQNALKGKAIYVIANTPEYTLIENEELIEQLDALSHAETQEGTTNITSSGILPAILEVTPNLIESIRGKQTTPIVGYNITGDDDLINFKITSKADSNGNILGATSQSQVDIEIFNENNTHNLENKQVYISTGLAETEGNYCKWQPFTITQTKDTQTKNHTTYTGYDDMMRGNEAYIDNVDYGEEGITLYDFTCKLAKEMGMALGNTTMTNGDFIVKGNNFTNNETKLVVLKNVAQMAGGFAMIDRDNLLRIVELSPEEAMTPIELTTNLYTEDFQNSAKFGEINEFAIGETNIETNAIVRSDDASIAKNGVKKIEILDNMFLGLLEDKETAIEPLWDAFNGFSYYPFKTPYNGYPYIDLGDKINITDINSNVYSTLVLNNVFEYNGGYKGNIGAEALSITAAKYKTNNTLSKQFRKVGIDIDRVEGKITSEIDAATDGITKAYNTAIKQTADKIGLSVTAINNTISGNPEVEGDTGLAGLVQTINSSYLTVDSDGFKAVSSTATAAQEKADAVEENTRKIVSQLQFDAATGLTISAEGSTDDDMKLNLTNSQVNFMYRNSPVLVINGNKIEFTGATFQKFDLGNYVWQAEDDDSLSLIYEGD